MKIIDVLEKIILQCEEVLDIAELQIQSNIINTGNAGHPYKGWCREKKEAEKKIAFFKKLLHIAEQDKNTGIKVANLYKPKASENVPRLCWSNYRVVLLYNTQTGMVDPFFWTPELGIDNSHHSLVMYAEKHYRDDKGAPIHDISYMWGGFYTYGLGNGDQKQLTLYGESSDYRHDEYSEEIKRCFMAKQQFKKDLIAQNPPF